MCVVMMLRIQADPARLQEVVNDGGARVQAVSARAGELGAIHHRFLGSADGSEINVLDEWESPEAFRTFFESSSEIPQITREVGVGSEPEITF
jgi:heme-degrading monooxygenase HmoA